MTESKVFNSGNSQAVRIPKDYRLADNETVIFNRVGYMLQIIPKSRAEEIFREGIDEFSEDYFKDGRQQGAIQERDGL